jgi:hypothetical protein
MTMHSDLPRHEAASNATRQTIWMSVALLVVATIALWFVIQ